jgi:hypothetical protein
MVKVLDSGKGVGGEHGRTTQSCSPQRLGNNAEYHGTLVDYEACAAHVVVCIFPHVVVAEFGPLHVVQVEAPYYCHLCGWCCGVGD